MSASLDGHQKPTVSGELRPHSNHFESTMAHSDTRLFFVSQCMCLANCFFRHQIDNRAARYLANIFECEPFIIV